MSESGALLLLRLETPLIMPNPPTPPPPTPTPAFSARAGTVVLCVHVISVVTSTINCAQYTQYKEEHIVRFFPSSNLQPPPSDVSVTHTQAHYTLTERELLVEV